MKKYDTVLADLKAQGIHSILTQFCDLHGVAKGKLVPLDNLAEWVEQGAGFAGSSIWGTGLGRFGARSEYYGRVQLESLRPLPFMPGVAHAVCDGFAGGQPLASCSRQLLKAQLAKLKALGLTLWVGIEPEFFLLQRDASGQWGRADAQDQLDKPSYDLKAIYRNRAFLDDMRQNLSALGFELQQMDHEDACGQYEINYRFDDALAAADRYMLFKMTAHAVAEQHGSVFSCMPKPFADAPGSGLHFHLSLTDADGNAVFHAPDDPLHISPVAYQFTAGLLHHADALSAICAPTVNSFKRLALSHSASGTTWAPVWKAYGDNNRTCLVRTVAGRLEWRLPDPSCNVYAAIAATLAAGLDGMKRQLSAPTACSEDLYERFAAGQPMPEQLPRDLGLALDAFAADPSLMQALGVEFCDQFLQIKRQEWSSYSQSVSDWEFARYARLF
ncbi:MAG: type III glutamate--ammonia ligase [Comamonadaceae bacterium CG_4_9_14_0_8_um_filter_57_21]|nr:type III glutamate--ammonia ligase [Rhodoferax sp.]PIZ21998.1 MAG: type III glutamate--ammonia ligase [Comamonadaceae bacterium CG_4_10_14_0_8_um_filter_57_29]PJC21198.1 MAG: type III glutamate--ammonia ligase [Comamonadaceae bacterium CG_4_9_14_0_8_um_filter_57_21]